MQAQKISRKAAAAGFEWECADDVWAKVAEEVQEFKEAATSEEAEDEFGDILFALVNVARWHHVDAEGAPRRTCAKFRSRWSFIEGAAWAQGRDAAELSMDEMEELWRQAKAQTRNSRVAFVANRCRRYRGIGICGDCRKAWAGERFGCRKLSASSRALDEARAPGIPGPCSRGGAMRFRLPCRARLAPSTRNARALGLTVSLVRGVLYSRFKLASSSFTSPMP